MPRRKSPKESSIVRSILDDLRLRGRSVWFRKNHGGPFGSSGVPDLEVVFRPVVGTNPDGSPILRDFASIVFLEVKKPGEKPTALQEATMRAIAAAGAHVRVVFSKREAVEFLESLGIAPKTEVSE